MIEGFEHLANFTRTISSDCVEEFPVKQRQSM